ncbi:MAG: hypothetical protein WD649_02410 [Thermoleophilaceae bacterium]
MLALTFAASVGGGDAERARPLETIIQDDALLLHRDPASVRATARRMKALGVDRVRITAGWSALAPSPTRRRKPRFDATDSLQYPERPFHQLDNAIKEVRAAGMGVMLDVAFFAPRWAVRRKVRGDRQRWRPKWQEFGQFALAVSRRYSGGWPDPTDPQQKLPVVRRWTTWNEPNHPVFLLPQRKRGPNGTTLAASPHIYRNLHNAAYRSIKAVDSRNQVLGGGLAADAGRSGEGIAPLEFVRELACVNAALQPLRRKACQGFQPLQADGFAHHPYTLDTNPAASRPNPDDVGLGDMDRLTKLLFQLRSRGRIARTLPVYITEYGYETNPPDPDRGVSPQTQARYMGLSTFIAWRNPELRSFAQFLLRDIEPTAGTRGGDYQTGLDYPDGRPKPAAQAFKLPIWAVVRPTFRDGRAKRVFVFGQIRPGRGQRRRVGIEVLNREGEWRELYTLPSNSSFTRSCVRGGMGFFVEDEGFFLRSTPYLGRRTTYRFRWFRSKSRSEVSQPMTVGG